MTGSCPRLSRAVSLTACSAAVLALAACGGGDSPKLARADAAGLLSLAHRIAGEGACGQARDIPRLRARAIALVNARRVPAALQEPLMSAVGALGAELPVCLPRVSTVATTPAAAGRPTPAPRPHARGRHPEPRHHHGHGHGR